MQINSAMAVSADHQGQQVTLSAVCQSAVEVKAIDKLLPKELYIGSVITEKHGA